MLAATTALEDMASNAQNGGFDSIMLPVLQQQGTMVGIDTSNLVIGGGWQQATITSSQTSTTSSKSSLSGGAIAGSVVGSIVGVALIGGLLFLASRRRTPQPVTPASELASTDTVVDTRPHNDRASQLVQTSDIQLDTGPPNDMEVRQRTDATADEAARVHNAAITEGTTRQLDDIENDGASQHLPTA
jgi:hypothetical protein